MANSNWAWVVIDRLTRCAKSKHRTYEAANRKACRMGDRYAVVSFEDISADTYQIQVRHGGRWLAWDRAGGGDVVAFGSERAARAAAIATGELAADDYGASWRAARVGGPQ